MLFALAAGLAQTTTNCQYEAMKPQERMDAPAIVMACTLEIAIRPTAEAYYYRSYGYQNLGQTNKAFKDLCSTIQLKPDHVGARQNRGAIYDENGMYAEAILDYSIAIQSNPLTAELYHNRGNSYVHAGLYQAAVENYTKALELNPRLKLTHHQRALAYIELDQAKLALLDLNVAIEEDPQPKVFFHRAMVHRRLGNEAKAKEDLAKAMKAKP